MKDKQIKKLNNYQDISAFLNKNKQKWSNIIELENALSTFNNNIQKISELKKEQEKDTSGLLKEKADKRIDLISKAVPVSNVLQVYAYDKGDSALSKKISFSKNKLAKSRDNVLVEKIDLLIKVANQLYNKSLYSDSSKKGEKTINFGNYGITKTLIEDLASENVNFSQTILKLKEAIAYRNKCSKKITEKLKANNKLLVNKIDKLFTLFELSNKDFYNSYIQIREKESGDKVKQKNTLKVEKTIQKPSGIKPQSEPKPTTAIKKTTATKSTPTKKSSTSPKSSGSNLKANTTVTKDTQSNSDTKPVVNSQKKS